MKLGVIEGFFGPAWPEADRRTWAPFLAEHGMDFYIYAPKADPFLRKRWREDWPETFLEHLRGLASHFRAHGVRFGAGFSPFGLGDKLSDPDRRLLLEKVRMLEGAGVEMLGIFFDDMMATPGLAAMQVEVMKAIRGAWKGSIVFCPTYYSDDPILDKVFGARDPGYVAEIGQGISPDIEIAWTGPKVISDEIPPEHLRSVAGLLRRKPFLWDNLFANDGPKNCFFLKWKDPQGRTAASASEVSFWGLNPMNQCHLSKLVFLAASFSANQGLAAAEAFEKSLRTLCSPGLAAFIRENRQRFLSEGLKSLDEALKSELAAKARAFHEPMADEIARWLMGEYVVGSECLTD